MDIMLFAVISVVVVCFLYANAVENLFENRKQVKAFDKENVRFILEGKPIRVLPPLGLRKEHEQNKNKLVYRSSRNAFIQKARQNHNKDLIAHKVRTEKHPNETVTRLSEEYRRVLTSGELVGRV